METIIQPNEIRESVREYYAERARQGSSCCSPSNPHHDIALLEGLPEDVAGFTLGCGDAVSLASLQAGETVVDLGSGGGLECFIASRQVGAQGKVIGVDMTPEMLSKAWAAAAKLKTANVDFRYGFLEALPIADGTADVIMSNCVLNLSPDKPQVFREMVRALKPGGRIAVSDVVSDGELSEAVRRDMLLWGGCYAGALDMRDYAAQLQAAGFVDIAVVPKRDASDDIVSLRGKVFSAAITARKPTDKVTE